MTDTSNSRSGKLLSEDELRDFIRSVYVSGVTAQLAGDFGNQAETEKHAFDLIQEQKRLHGEYVIGENSPVFDVDDPHLQSINQYKNVLRAAQRARNQL